MNPMTWALLVAALALTSGAARAQPRAYEVGRQPGDIGIALKVPYSLGTHTAAATAVGGELFIDPETLSLVRGRLVVPVTSIEGGSSRRDCHMREALSLDYGRSRFPREHVCDGNGRLWTSTIATR